MCTNLSRIPAERGGCEIGMVIMKKVEALVEWCHDREKEGLPLGAAAFNNDTLMRYVKKTQLADVKSKKRKRPIDVQVMYQEPVPKDFCMVPMDTITAYQKLLHQFQRPSHDLVRPFYFLYGPRQFGKTTLAIHLSEEIQLDSTIELIYLCFHLSFHAKELFWRAIGALI